MVWVHGNVFVFINDKAHRRVIKKSNLKWWKVTRPFPALSKSLICPAFSKKEKKMTNLCVPGLKDFLKASVIAQVLNWQFCYWSHIHTNSFFQPAL